MLPFKRVLIDSGFNKRRLLELLKTYEKPDPEKFPKRVMNLDIPEDLFRVHWVSNEEFDFKYFKFFTGKSSQGYALAQMVRVRLSGDFDRPVIVVRPHVGAWLSDLFFLLGVGLFWLLLAGFNFYFGKPPHDPTAFRLILLYGLGLSLIFILYRFFRFPCDCEKRLRHLAAADDWDPGSAKTGR